MSILIRDMEMPKNCLECELKALGALVGEYYCPITKIDCLSIGRQDDCPLEEVPSAQPDSNESSSTHKALDTIDRQAAIDALDCINGTEEVLRSLPSAQPEPSQVARDIATIIENEQDMRVVLRNAQPDLICKDCKHYDRHNKRCRKWNHGVRQIDWCSRAERRENESD